MKQTAVQQLEEYLTISLGKDRMRMLANEFEKAKAMEKEQIIDAAMWMPKSFNTEFIPELAEQYYNENYKEESDESNARI